MLLNDIDCCLGLGNQANAQANKYTATQRAACLCWIKLNPEQYEQAKDEQSLLMADMFEKVNYEGFIRFLLIPLPFSVSIGVSR